MTTNVQIASEAVPGVLIDMTTRDSYTTVEVVLPDDGNHVSIMVMTHVGEPAEVESSAEDVARDLGPLSSADFALLAEIYDRAYTVAAAHTEMWVR